MTIRLITATVLKKILLLLSNTSDISVNHQKQIYLIVQDFFIAQANRYLYCKQRLAQHRKWPLYPWALYNFTNFTNKKKKEDATV